MEKIIEELLSFQADNPSYFLAQFSSRAGAHQYLRLYQLFVKTVPPGSRVLDWGCGNGHFSYFLLRNNYWVSAFSMENHLLPRKLQEKYREYDYRTGDLKDAVRLPFQDNSFHVVSSVGVLEHVRETGGEELKSLLEIKRVLQPGGFFICYHFPNRLSWIEAVVRLFPSRHHHPWKYTEREIEKLCQKSGIELVLIKRYGFLPRNFWGGMPRFFRNSRLVAAFWDRLDAALSFALNPFCQNYLLVARKTG